MDLKDILADSKQFADSVVVNVNNQPFTLGALRTLTAAQQKALSDREKAAQDKEAQLAKQLEELNAARVTTANLYADIVKREEALKAAGPAAAAHAEPDPLERLESDNILGPLVKSFRAKTGTLEQQLANQTKVNEQLLEGIKRMGESYLTDRLTDIYERTVPEANRSKISLESLIQHALTNKYNTKAGYADISRSYKELTAAETQAASEATLREKIEKVVREKLLAEGIIVRPPTGMGGGLPSMEGPANVRGQAFASLDKAFEAAAKDADLWRQFNGIDASNIA